MASFYKTGKGWRALLCVKGQRDSSVFTTKGEAVAWAAKRETELREQKGGVVVSGKTLGDAFERYECEVSRHKRGHRWEVLRMHAMAEHELGGKKMGSIMLSDLSVDHIGR